MLASLFRPIKNGEKQVSGVDNDIFDIYSFSADISTRVQAAPEERLGGVKEINGIKYAEDIILGIPVVKPV